MQISLTDEVAQAIYRAAIEDPVPAAVSATWWANVIAEVRDVVSARDVTTAAALIAWWHHDWSAVGDTARNAAQRIRQEARRHRALPRVRPAAAPRP